MTPNTTCFCAQAVQAIIKMDWFHCVKHDIIGIIRIPDIKNNFSTVDNIGIIILFAGAVVFFFFGSFFPSKKILTTSTRLFMTKSARLLMKKGVANDIDATIPIRNNGPLRMASLTIEFSRFDLVNMGR